MSPHGEIVLRSCADIEYLYEKMQEGEFIETLRELQAEGSAAAEIPEPLGSILSPGGRANDVSEDGKPAITYELDWVRTRKETMHQETLEVNCSVSDELTVTMDDPETLEAVSATYVFRADDKL